MIVCNILYRLDCMCSFAFYYQYFSDSLHVSVSCGVSLIQYHDYIAAIFIY